MLSKQPVNRYLRNHGGSAADKSRDRQRKLDGSDRWHFHLVIESLPVMFQIVLLSLGRGLPRYLWTIGRGHCCHNSLGSHHVFFVLAATLYYNCSYQTSPSILTRTTVGCMTHGDATFAGSLQ